MKNSVGEYQNILVLGGRSDIGSAIASKLSTDFTKHVILAGRDMNESDVQRFRRTLEGKAASIEVSVRSFDATDHSGHEAFVKGLEAEAVDLIIVAFGQLGDQEHFRDDPSSAAALVSVNFAGVVSVSLACARLLEKQGSGHLVFLSSVAGIRARKSNFVYGSTKAGMDAFAQGLSDDLEPKGVRVTIVRPGFVRSRMTTGLEPAPFATSIEDVAERVADGMRRGKRVIWAPPILKYVFTLLRILPTVVWRRLPFK